LHIISTTNYVRDIVVIPWQYIVTGVILLRKCKSRSINILCTLYEEEVPLLYFFWILSTARIIYYRFVSDNHFQQSTKYSFTCFSSSFAQCLIHHSYSNITPVLRDLESLYRNPIRRRRYVTNKHCILLYSQICHTSHIQILFTCSWCL
jgi:hypothetical protein